MVNNFASLLDSMTVSRPQTERQILPQYVSEGWRLTIAVCGRAHRDPNCGLFFTLASYEPSTCVLLPF